LESKFRAMANWAPSILSISYDESLLRTREWLLRAAGFTVTSALGFTEAVAHCGNSDFDLVIIGHSIPQKDTTALIERVRTHNHTRILSLRRQGEEPIQGADYSVESAQGPDALLEAVKAALGRKSTAGTD
jgi:DNA-binding response OmpR family regulator